MPERMTRTGRFAAGSAALMLMLTMTGCGGGGSGGGGGGPGDDPGDGTADRTISFNTDPDVALAAVAEHGENTQTAAYGAKNDEGDLTSVDQLDFVTASGSTVSMQLDEDGQPVYISSSDGDEAAFTYDEDTGTVVATTSTAGATTVTEASTSSGTNAATAKRRPLLSKTQEDLCEHLSTAIGVLDSVFDCDDETDCDDPVSQATLQLQELCEADFEEVDDLDTTLGTTPQDIALGVKTLHTTRPASEGGTTVILTATPFGGTRPYEAEWSYSGGPAAVAVENLPGGAAVADIFTDGSYTFEVTITDAEGAIATAQQTVDTSAVARLQIETSNAYPLPGETVTFAVADGGESASDAGRFTYLWNFGDGSTGEGSSVEHAFDAAGEYLVQVVATSDDGRRAKGAVPVLVDDEQDCKVICFDQSGDTYYNCVLGGGTDAECAAEALTQLEACAMAECGEPIDCDKICHVEAREVYAACTAAGLEDSDCETEALASLDACLSEQCGGEELSCEDLCAKSADAVFQQCLNSDLTTDECNDLFHATYADCTAFGCGEVRNCEDQCSQRAKRGFELCLRSGGGETECASRARAFAEECLADDCGTEGDCPTLCGDEAHRVYDKCLARGGDADRCQTKADEYYQVCQEEHCDETTNECESACVAAADSAMADCLASGGTEDACLSDAEAMFAACLYENCGQTSDCATDCVASALGYYEGCVAETGDAESCAYDAFNGVTVCMTDECGQTAQCEDCTLDGLDTLAECAASATEAYLCGQYAIESVADCIQDDCEDDGDDDGEGDDGDGGDDEGGDDGTQDCEEYCEASAADAYEMCLADGGAADDCSLSFDDNYAACLEAHCDE